MPYDAPSYRDAVAERLDDELSHWQSRVDHLRLCLLGEGAPGGLGLQAALEQLETELEKAKRQWQQMISAPTPDWACERNTLMATLIRIQRSFYELQSRHRRR